MKSTYTLQIEKLISSEFKRLDNITYLEHAGATLYSDKQISNICSELQENVYANPHARSTTSKSTEDAIDQIRYQILQHFGTNADEYSVIFTSGATASLKLVAETFDYASNNSSHFTYLEDNHTSVLGMRVHADNAKSISHELAYETFASEEASSMLNSNESNSLFVYPAQSNFSGFKYPLAWIDKVQKGVLNNIPSLNSKNWFCMLDAASFISTNPLDLSIYKPDFICMSFYKLFGYPTGIGALLVRNKSAWILQKQYYGGGTVFMALSSENIVIQRKKIHERFEDGTIPFLSIMALRHGFDTLNRMNLTMKLISNHTYNLSKYVFDNLSKFRHNNGNQACILYHDNNFDDIQHQGGIVNFNLLRNNGTYIGYSEVMHIANLYGIQLRTGCFCNPGACQRHLKLSNKDIRYHYEQGHVCGDQNDLIDGYPTGSVRISFGYMSTKRNADDFLEMITECFISKPKLKTEADTLNARQNNKPLLKYSSNSENTEECKRKDIKGTLEQIYVYPIKSCGQYSVKSCWELVSTGLKFDREWMVVNPSGVCLTQKQETKMCLIKPIINLEDDTLELTYEGLDNICIPLSSKLYVNKKNDVIACQSKICEDQINGWDCGDDVSNWLSKALNRNGLRLLRQCSTTQGVMRTSKKDSNQLSLVNKSQFLMINKVSAQWLHDCIPKEEFTDSVIGLINRFRPNFIVNFPKLFDENYCTNFNFGRTIFLSEGLCTRCQMICIDQTTGDKSVEPLKTISKEFNGKISFGIYLKQENTYNSDKIYINMEIIGF